MLFWRSLCPSLPLSAMPACPCVTSLNGGGWFFDVLGFGQTQWDGLECSGWQNHGGAMEYRWLHLDGPGQSRRQHQGGPWAVLLAAPWWRYGVLLAAPWWPWAVLWAASWWLQLVVCAAGSVGETDAPRPALRLFDALAAGSMLPRPVVATSGLLDCFAWLPSLVEFHGASPFSSTWGLMLVATRAPFDCPCSFGCARLQCVSRCYWPPIPWLRSGCWACPGPWFALLPLLDYGASAPMVRFVPMAVVGCLRGGYSLVGRLVLPLALTLDLFTDWRILYRNVPSARPRERVLSCFPS
ncbi:hypothetical protein V6N12_013834 [Hibiscus sabdariffa]|uniref:Uncharacterized protein n=1 Tax=Hibiscus sabdariffa TaxID=183260 RepID=A0ABR2AL56_9ROSI